MAQKQGTAILALLLVSMLGGALAWAGSQGGIVVRGAPLFGMLVALTFLIQWFAFLPAYRWQSEKYFDLTGSATFIAITSIALYFSNPDSRSLLLGTLVFTWAARLGLFLFSRIQRAGKDGRFDEIKPFRLRFLLAWTLQGLWITFTNAAALMAITSQNTKEWDVFCLGGLFLWILGYCLEFVADWQKNRFKAVPVNRDRFIQEGLWSRARHPNYFGEIVLWTGMALIAYPVLAGWQRVGLLSPLFVAVLLIWISGVPLLEKRAEEKWGKQAEYQRYKRNTPLLVPRLFPKR
jgi:steroid 5-alpha reductase family enzyme